MERLEGRKVKEAFPVLRVVSILAGGDVHVGQAREALSKVFGGILLESARYPFDMSSYYESEMGEDLFRIWVAFEVLAPAEDLPDWKLTCAALEGAQKADQARRVNLDPGYIDPGKLVLASFKEAPDKIYLGRGVWAHTVLRYRFGHYEAPDHSFPDFRDGRFDSFMLEARRTHKALLRTADKGGVV
jgi:hypothetical protein